MSCRIESLCFDSIDPTRLAEFWAEILGLKIDDASDYGVTLLANSTTGFNIDFFPTDSIKSVPNHMHFDLTSNSPDDQKATVAKCLSLGARHTDIGQSADVKHVVLADPEGNEFCVIEPGNNFLSDCGFVGAVSCEGSQETGFFWSKALNWPLVWDQNQETAVRSPLGGPKITWGGPPLTPKTKKNRLHFDVAPSLGGDHNDEVERLISLGARRIDIGQRDVSWVVMADPDGHEFCVLTPR